MRNVAIPIVELQALQARGEERQRLAQQPVIGEGELADRLKALDKEANEAIREARKKRGAIQKSEADEKARKEQLHQLDIDTDLILLGLRKRKEQLELMLTEEARARRLAELDAQEERFAASYGPQHLSDEERAQQHADRVASEEYTRTHQYADDRRAEYPPIGDQLDALWKALEGRKLPPEAEAVRARIADIKARHPKPEEA